MPVLHHSAMSFLHIIIGPIGKLAGLGEDHPPAIPCFLENVQTIGILVHDSVITVHIFEVLLHFHGTLPHLK